MRVVPFLLLLGACAGDQSAVGIGVLGGGQHTVDAVTIEVIATAADGLNTPTDVAINPRAPEQLWVTNFADNGIVRFTNDVAIGKFNAPGSEHFLASPSGLAFSDFGNFATSQDTDEATQAMTPADFMGPTLWDDSDAFDGGHSGHLDMLHNSPNGGGIAWERDNVYWVFDGAHGSLTRYDFGEDHGHGGADHSDGVIDRYAEGLVGHVQGIPSAIEYVEGLLYVADGLNQRVVTFDPSSSTRAGAIGPDYDGADMAGFTGGEVITLATGGLLPVLDERGNDTVLATALGMPAGLAVHEGLIYVTDYSSGNVVALTLDGELVDWIPTGRANALGGIDVDAEGRLVIADKLANEVIRISAN